MMQQFGSKLKYSTVILMVILAFLGYGFDNVKNKSDNYISIHNGKQLDNGELSGKELFRRNCATCHGEERQGKPPIFPSLIDVDQRRNKNEVELLLLTGGNIMPKFSHLSDSERNAIVAFLYGKETRSNEVTEISAFENGKNTFVANCARCHQSIPTEKTPPDQKPWGRKPPVLGGISNKFNENQFKNILNTGPMYMPSFTALSNNEKEDIYTYLNSIDSNKNLFRPKKRRGCGMKR